MNSLPSPKMFRGLTSELGDSIVYIHALESGVVDYMPLAFDTRMTTFTKKLKTMEVQTLLLHSDDLYDCALEIWNK